MARPLFALRLSTIPFHTVQTTQIIATIARIAFTLSFSHFIVQYPRRASSSILSAMLLGADDFSALALSASPL